MTELNVPLLRKELEFLTAHPELHFQGDWIHEFACGTGGCLAASPGAVPGCRPVWRDEASQRGADYVHFPGDSEWRARPVRAVAAEALGLNPAQRDALFAGGNSVRQLWQIAAGISHGEIQVPLDLPRDPP